ncbi:MAG: tripartite tricarboxylate transporter substrate binding protein [Dehalococcoidia bacterium]
MKLKSMILASIAAMALVAPAVAQYPERPLRIVVPTDPGGDIDTIARAFQRTFQEQGLFDTVVVINQPGGGGTIGTRAIKDAEPDGYTIGLWTPGIITSAAMGVVEYDHTSFEIIGGSGAAQIGLGIKSDAPYADVTEMIEALKAEPESMTVASNIGLPVHFLPMMFAEEAGIDLRYAQVGGGAARMASILGGHTDIAMFSISEFLNYAEGGLRPIVLFSAERDERLPDVPTAREAGVDFVIDDARIWLAPAGVPEERLEYLRDAIRQVLADEEVSESFRSLGLEPDFQTPEQIEGQLDDMLRRALPLVEQAKALAQ